MDIIGFLVYVIVAFILAAVVIALTKLSNEKRTEKPVWDFFESGVDGPQIFGKRHSAKFFSILVVFLLLNINIFMLIPWIMIYQKYPDKLLMIGVFSFYTIILMSACLFTFFHRALEKENLDEF